MTISDNGQGMTAKEFEDYWMRIGSQHKRGQENSRVLGRALTGSKGVGRLAAQFLAHKVVVITKAKSQHALHASVDWDNAVAAGELTKARALVREAEEDEVSFPENCDQGTTIELVSLKQEWTDEEVKTVARDLWMLQPPLEADREKMRFSVRFRSDKPGLEKDFESQMRAILDIWHARITGKLIRNLDKAGNPIDSLQMLVEFRDGRKYSETLIQDKILIDTLEYDIRVYDFVGRQKHGIPVSTARAYLEQFGNVSVYDAGFRMPFYGRETDWLDIEVDHSHRLSVSRLLPHELQISSGMSNLPTMTRILGSARINTSAEQRAAPASVRFQQEPPKDYLQISITRDRLVDNNAFRQLKNLVRTGIDYYAMLQTRRKAEEALRKKPTEPITGLMQRLELVLERHKDELPSNVYERVRKDIAETASEDESESGRGQAYVGLLGGLATAGMLAASYQHEVERRLSSIEGALIEIEQVLARGGMDISALIATIRAAVDEMRKNRALFADFADQSAREAPERFRASVLIRDVYSRIERFLRGVVLDVDELPDDLRLPPASYVEWAAVFQNVLTNAANAMLDSPKKLVHVTLTIEGKGHTLRLEDTGSGVELRSAESLFEPFVRRTKVSAERRALGLGGSGLGLTIVRMICQRVGCKAAFLPPTNGFHSCFALSWRET